MEIARVHELSESQAKSMSGEDQKVNWLKKKKPWKSQHKAPDHRQSQPPKTVKLHSEQFKNVCGRCGLPNNHQKCPAIGKSCKNVMAKITLLKCVARRKKVYIWSNRMTVIVITGHL